MSNNPKIKLEVKLHSYKTVTKISDNSIDYQAECKNLEEGEKELDCPINLDNPAPVSSVYNVDSLYRGLELSNYDTQIQLFKRQDQRIIEKSLLGVADNSEATVNLPGGVELGGNASQEIDNALKPENRPSTPPDLKFDLNVEANLNLRDNTLISTNINSPNINIEDKVRLKIAGESCIRANITDTIYSIRLVYDGEYALTQQIFFVFPPATPAPNIDIKYAAQEITNNATTITLLNANQPGEKAIFYRDVDIDAKLLVRTITAVEPYDCPELANNDDLTLFTNGLSRYGPVTDDSGNNQIGIYSFGTSKTNEIFNYNDIDLYYKLVTRDTCFKIQIWIFGFIFVFPLWIDAKIVTSILGALEGVLNKATGVFTDARDKANALKGEVNLKNAVAVSQRGVAVGKLVASGQANGILLDAAKDYFNKQLSRLEALKNYNDILNIKSNAEKIINKGKALINTLSQMDAVIDMLNGRNGGDEATARALLDAIIKANNAIDDAFQEFSNLVDKAPDSAVKRKAQSIIRAIVNYLDHLDNLAIKKAQEVDKTNPVEIVIAVLDVIIDIEGIKKFFAIAEEMNLMQLAYDLILEQVDQFGAIKTAAELDEAAARQKKSEAEQALGQAATAAATEVDKWIGSVGEVIQVQQLENLANEGLDLAVSGVRLAADLLGGAAEGIGGKKRDVIRGVVAHYLINNIDLYKLSRLGRFDENNPTQRQILVNDLSGTRIYSSDGNTLLFEDKKLCHHPFNPLKEKLDSGGCQKDRDPCGVGGFKCQEKNYRYRGLKYRVSFDFDDNQDLAKGGVLIGDWDGDGIDDIMCHYPGSMRNYDEITKDYSEVKEGDKTDIAPNNEIIYSPLKSLSTNGRFSSRRQSLTLEDNSGNLHQINHWCRDGRIFVGDFNGDKKSDLLCHDNGKNYVLYSNGYTFKTAGDDPFGMVTIVDHHLTTKSTTAPAIPPIFITGDFDGDGNTDILKVIRLFFGTTVSILYGNKDSVFITRSSETNAWSDANKESLKKCQDENRIIVEDINNDGRDDITCISEDNVKTEIISTIPTLPTPAPETPESGGYARIYVDDVTLSPFDNLDVAKRARVNHHVFNNKISAADKILIGHDHMLPDHKTISDISVSFGCLRLGGRGFESHISFSTSYLVPEKILWDNARSDSTLLLNLDISARMNGNNPISIESEPIKSFEYKLEAFKGGCYNSETVTSFASIIVNYNATAKNGDRKTWTSANRSSTRTRSKSNNIKL